MKHVFVFRKVLGGRQGIIRSLAEKVLQCQFLDTRTNQMNVTEVYLVMHVLTIINYFA